MAGASLTIRGSVSAKVVTPGTVTLPAGKLHEIARSLPDAEVKFKLGERNQVAITCKRTRYKIAGQSREEFPNFPEFDEDKGVRLPGPVLRGLIERVAFAITNPEGPVVLDVELGPQAFLFESKVNGNAGGEEFGEHREVYTRLGLLGGLGLRLPAGPGEFAIQALVTTSRLDGRITGPTQSTAFSPSAGYRFVF